MPITEFGIVLDIDQTLLNTNGDQSLLEKFDISKHSQKSRLYLLEMIDVVDEPATGKKTIMCGILRPHLRNFLDFCNKYFKYVIIWSAGRRIYVERACDYLFPCEYKADKIYVYDDCIIEGKSVAKPLTKVYNDFPELNETNTFALDDRKDTFSLNVENGIQIPVFDTTLSEAGLNKFDDNLKKLCYWLLTSKVKNCNDIRKLDKSNIFNTSITEYHQMIKAS